jgi:hypothetical protein
LGHEGITFPRGPRRSKIQMPAVLAFSYCSFKGLRGKSAIFT